MFRRGLFAVFFLKVLLLSSPALAETIAECGPSAGSGYFFADPIFNPDGGGWLPDQISNGHIRLVRLGDQFDIQFGDVAGSYSYAADGATIAQLGFSDGIITIGAFRPNYTDIYTFDLNENVVVWSSHKLGPFGPKAAIYSAQC